MYRTVIVEDDPMVSLLNRTYTEKDDRFQVAATFQDGRTALNWLVQNPADLLILDVYMPVYTGLQLLRELRVRLVDLDAILVTAANDPKTVDELLKLGAVDYLVKPFTYERFQQALNTFCLHRQAVKSPVVSQSALDRTLSPAAVAQDAAMPKGLQEDTLKLIRSVLRASASQGATSEALSEKTGLSSVTVRRYVNYLVDKGEISRTMNYDTGGRPCHLYRYPSDF